MLVRVTEDGFVIPKHLLPGVHEVEVRVENGMVLVVPAPDAAGAEDPIFGLGKSPVECGIPDFSENHDKYIYDDPE